MATERYEKIQGIAWDKLKELEQKALELAEEAIRRRKAL